MKTRVVLIKHNDEPDDDRVVGFCRMNAIEVEILRPFKGETLPLPDGGVAASVVYGGPFNVFETDRHSFLRDEHRWIEACMDRRIPLLGICQGAQSIAHVLGAPVGPKEGSPYEFGYYPVCPSEAGQAFLPQEIYFPQWHYHCFGLPEGALKLASSALFENQAMRYEETTFAFQFHPEVTREGFRRWQDHPQAPYASPGAQSREEQDNLAACHDPRLHDWFFGFLADFLADLSRRTGRYDEAALR